jgi:hypothetical protein
MMQEVETTPLDRVFDAVMEALEEGEKVYKIREQVEDAIIHYRTQQK